MRPAFFGDSLDMTKRQIMQWLAPGVRWEAHPMWYRERPAPEWARPFLPRYAVALDVDIVAGESDNRAEFLQAATACETHLLLDPDTGLWIGENRGPNTHVQIGDFIQIVRSPNRQRSLTLIYEHSYYRDGRHGDIWQETTERLHRLTEANVHAVAYMAHEGSKVRFVWASKNPDLVTEATRNMQQESQFPVERFIDGGRGHVG